MDEATARELSRLTSAFYQQVSASFSATRQDAWPGWQRVLDEVTASGQPSQLRVLDLACGNLRFERYLATMMPGATPRVEAYAFDNCDALAKSEVSAGVSLHFCHLDVTEELFSGHDFASQLDVPPCDLAVSFGFMHHLPLPEHRAQVLKALVARTAPGGIVAVSFWQLSRSPRLLAKAQAITAARGITGLDQGDYLLGWQDRTDVVRYCHDFSEAEIDVLARTVAPAAKEVARFSADGKTGDLNRYLVLRKA